LSFVLDASVALCWCFEDEADRYARSVFPVLRSLPAVVPAIWPAEFGNGLMVAERRKRISQTAVTALLSAFRELPIPEDDRCQWQTRRELVSMARQHGLSVYDTLYLDIALQQELPLAMIDKQMKRAARKLGVELFKP